MFGHQHKILPPAWHLQQTKRQTLTLVLRGQIIYTLKTKQSWFSYGNNSPTVNVISSIPFVTRLSNLGLH